MKKRIILSWSGGKDSALALYELQKAQRYEIVALLTIVTEGYERISMHGVRISLLKEQAEAVGYPLEKIVISKNSSNREYELKMGEVLAKYKNAGVSCVAIGDIFLEDLRRHREEKLSEIEMKGVFPLWKRDTAELARTFINLGFKAVVTCVDTNVLDKRFVGRQFDKVFLSQLPSSVDPCGEKGEFHSFVYDGPIFRQKISHSVGEIVLRDERFYYCDLLPVQKAVV